MLLPIVRRKRGKVKLCCYEIPYSIIGAIVFTGLEETPKDMNEQIGILERGKVRTWSSSQTTKC